MKYIRTQKLIKKICDENVSDPEMISRILKIIRDRELFCAITIEKDYSVNFYPKTRILEIKNDKITFRSFNDKAMLKDSVPINNIKELKVETELELITKKTDKDDKWMLLDLEEES